MLIIIIKDLYKSLLKSSSRSISIAIKQNKLNNNFNSIKSPEIKLFSCFIETYFNMLLCGVFFFTLKKATIKLILFTKIKRFCLVVN